MKKLHSIHPVASLKAAHESCWIFGSYHLPVASLYSGFSFLCNGEDDPTGVMGLLYRCCGESGSHLGVNPLPCTMLSINEVVGVREWCLGCVLLLSREALL